MKSLYKRQLTMMVGIMILSFTLLSAAFMLLSYRYIISETRNRLERNADYIAAANTWLQDRFLFGSAYPLMPIVESLAIFKTLFKEEVLPKLLYKNAAAFVKPDLDITNAIITRCGGTPPKQDTAKDGAELAPLSYGLAQCLYGRIGLYAPEFSIFTTGQSLDDLFINTVFLHASAAESYHYLFPGRNLRSYFLYHPFSEDELCRILKNKIIHSRIFISLYFQYLQMYSFMLHGRSCPATKNMHKRFRIAHVSCIRTTACRTAACNSR